MEDNANDRYRLFFLLLYKDSTIYDYDEVLFNLKSYKNYAYIEHQPEQTEKKQHTHFLLKLDNATTKRALSKKIGLGENYIERGRNERALARYLIHSDDDEKIQYSIEEVHCSKNYIKQFKKHLDDLETEEQIIQNIYNFIDNLKNQDNINIIQCFKLLSQYVNSNSYDTIYKRYRYEFKIYLTGII